MIVTDRPDLEQRLIAGRRAAHMELQRLAHTKQGYNYAGPKRPEDLNSLQDSGIGINGFDITTAIDAAIMEGMVQSAPPAPAPSPAPKRKWWRFW